ncbi:hypothetical protein WN51_01238 [Melipona quadrifasciata]|uniref:Right handed beta helix domain-containing protein n=1 Tax=Melipona quadrifasciata TaxID=166423 RepID=A0A0N0U4Z6_9HYME|nr:hypothetical protein WN51_01238 [Melipona quadrifasciata]
MAGLRAVDLINVANLSLVRQSFELSPQNTRTRISVRNCSIDAMPSFVFRGDVEAIIFENVRIGQLSAFSFANLVHTEKLRLENCRIENVEAQAFKKFDVGHLRVIGGSFGDQVPSRTMNDVEVYHTFMLDGVRMGTVRSEAFIVRSPRTVAIQNCVVESLESEAFDVTARGPVIVKNNTFGSLSMGAFLGIRADPEARTASLPANLHDLIFKNNSVANFEEGSMMFDRGSFRLELDSLLVDQPCDCQMLPVWKNNILNYTNVYSRFYAKQSNAGLPPTLSPQDNAINETPETFLCSEGEVSGVPTSFVEYETRHCSLGGSILVFVAVVAGLLAFLILLVCLVVWCCRRRRRNSRKKWISVPMNAPDVVSKKNGVIGREAASSAAPVDSRITMVVPDGRLYRETEFHVIVEKAEPLTTEL